MKLFNLLRRNKKAIMGIGTLIIFIATILVAAVAAGVLISTAGVLQQRALITGQEARKKITNAIEVISVVAHGNRTDESLNNFEILVRLDAGSDPIQMKKFNLELITENHDAAASLQDKTLNDPSVDEDGFNYQVSGMVSNDSWKTIRDLDGDGISEKIMIYSPNQSNLSDMILINFTSVTEENYYAYVNLTEDISNASNNPVNITLRDIPIEAANGFYYGYIQLNGTIDQNNTINASEVEFNITANPIWGCEFDTLAPERKYCFKVIHGNDDVVLGDGEVFKILYKMREENRLFIGEDFRFIFSSEKGRLTQVQARTPDIITSLKVPLWPVG